MGTKNSSKPVDIRKQRTDTKIATIEKKYGKDLGVRGDMKLGTYLKEKGYDSLNNLLKDKKRTK